MTSGFSAPMMVQGQHDWARTFTEQAPARPGHR